MTGGGATQPSRQGTWLFATVILLVMIGVAFLVLPVSTWLGFGKQGATEPAPASTSAAQGEVEQGVGLMGQFEFERAEKLFASAETLAPNWWVPKFNRAVAMLNMTTEGAQARAIEMLAPLREVPAARDRAIYCIALAELFMGYPARAQPLFAEVFSRNPNDAYAAFYTAQCTELLGDHAAARKLYERAAEIDPYLRSSYLGLQRTAARTGDEAASKAALERFQSLADDLRSTLAEFKYTRMGKLAEVVVEEVEGGAVKSGAVVQKPGVFFGNVKDFVVTGLRPDMRLSPGSPTTVDLDGDDFQDLVWPKWPWKASNPESVGLVCMGQPDGSFAVAENHPLSQVPALGLLWADLNNDGRADAVVNAVRDAPVGMHAGEVYALLQTDASTWQRTAVSPSDLQDLKALLLADLDHDGDIDILAASSDCPFLLLNRGDATFELRPFSNDHWDGKAAPVVGATLVDLGRDGDCDVVLIVKDAARHAQIWAQQGIWSWKREPAREPKSAVIAVAAIPPTRDHGTTLACLVIDDLSGDAPPTEVQVWDPAASGSVMLGRHLAKWAATLCVCDVDGTGIPSIVVGSGSGPMGVVKLQGSPQFGAFLDVLTPTAKLLQHKDLSPRMLGTELAPVVLNSQGLQVVMREHGSESLANLMILPPGPDRAPSAVVKFAGRIDPSQQMRSNASGIGAQYAARANGMWVLGAATPIDAGRIGAGQSLQPSVIGLGSAGKASFITIRWPDGVLQTELDLKPGLQTIVETQRQISSCPVIFAWDGSTHQFVTDCLGVGGMGYLVSAERKPDGTIAPVYAPPRPWERVLISESPVPGGMGGALQLHDGAYEFRLTEPMEEACYLDAARLVAYDLPVGWTLAVDERMGINGPQPTGEAWAYRTSVAPSRALANGAEATADVSERDGRAADLGHADPRFIGRLQEEAVLEFTFPQPLVAADGKLTHAGTPVLLIDGWVEYPYCQTNFAMWQAGVPYQAPTFEALDPATGAWVTLVAEYGYPAGMPRQASFPIPADKLPAGCTTLRLRTTMEVYFDRIAFVWNEPCPELRRAEAPLASAECAFAGFPKRMPRAQRRPDYDYNQRAPLWDCRLQFGNYTAYGECTPLIAATDDAVAIFGAGEEVRLRFASPAAPATASHRTWVLELDGWCKDMDRYTGQGKTVAPLPMRERSQETRTDAQRRARESLHAQFNTRTAGGR